MVIGPPQVAQAAAEAVGIGGLSAAAMTPGAFTTIALLMSICIMWGMVLSFFLNRWYLAKLEKIGRKEREKGFGDVAMTAMFIGLVSAYIGSYIGGFVSSRGVLRFQGDVTPIIVCLVSAAVMALLTRLSRRRKLLWIESFSIAASMLAGMLAAVVL